MFYFITTFTYSQMPLYQGFNPTSNAFFTSNMENESEIKSNSIDKTNKLSTQAVILPQNWCYPYQISETNNYRVEKQTQYPENAHPESKNHQLCQFFQKEAINQPVLKRQPIRQNSDEVKVSSLKKNRLQKKKSETKNLIKNYGRAMLTFIIRNEKLRKRLLHKLEIKEEQFLEEVYKFRNYIHTISALRYLWQSHPFNKAFRILCCQYLRKHNMKHVFNSRIFKHEVYLKYQEKLMKSLERPELFQGIKDS